ncbi:DUF3823 domain-containing protein [Parafilimonas sp.]|uniref:DUF3823 domain-containing protein n=1 Tax=Parafilimonas sp. TaxID=1969739 RepID=UPI0039E330CD
MKHLSKYMLAAGLGACIYSCKKDNYAPPGAMLTGNLLYNTDTIYVEKDAVHFQIYQYGFGKVGPISTNETFAQDGSYSAALFNGDYKLIIPAGDGPFVSATTSSGAPDSVAITMNGNQTTDIQVTPYYLIRNAQASASGDNVTASFSIDQIITGADAKDIESVNLYINKTQFVSANNNIAGASVSGSDLTSLSGVSMSVAIPSMTPTQSYVFARIGLKISGVEDMIFSPLFKVEF